MDSTPFDDRLVPVIGPAWRMVVHRGKTSMKSGFGNPRFVSATRTLFGQQIKFCLIGKNGSANQAGFVHSSSWSVLESSRTDLTLGDSVKADMHRREESMTFLLGSHHFFPVLRPKKGESKRSTRLSER